MINTGIVRHVDDLGRVVIPKEIRRTFNINEYDSIEFFIDDDSNLMMRKYQRGCILCGEIKNVKEFKGKFICRGCIEEL